MTAIIALPLLILLLGYANPAVFSVFLTIILFLSLIEFNRIGLGGEHRFEQWIAASIGAAVIPIQFYENIALIFPLYTVAILFLSLLFLFRLSEITVVHYRLGWITLGLVYLPFLLSHLMLLRLLPDGRQWIFMTLIVIMSCDSFAYFVGRKFGKRKLYQAVSPNKTIEGGVGGLVGAVFAIMLVKFTFLPILGFLDAVLIGLFLGVMGQLGDLFESLLKRACQVKDSGGIIPGHGGMLDRLDSLLFAFPVVYYLARYCYGG
ncbi:phosphatidate cytidylyltransferase [uncultured Desulfuromusa sp.]|uniref:phosphatidate cytidylyltransferase n=1 Tax=uncultured Desulfuromusa sp. TaxID=219183 RepID=UPI002AA87C28|nr:phosphatidate cytidylyltransferase [uncultured Desulfuromusa sp.]